MSLIDAAKPVREGEELDPRRIEIYLKDAIPGLAGQITITQFPSGHSNLTYLITAGDREFVLRRPPFGRKVRTAHDMEREYRVLKALRPYFPYCPEAFAYTEDESVMGCQFYVMERLKGIIPRKELPQGMVLSKDETRMLCKRLIDVFVELHRINYRDTALTELGRPEGYIRRQVEGWSKRYRGARTQDAPDFEAVMAWLQERMPGTSPAAAVIHNDYRFDNLVLAPEDPLRIIGVLDWEMATIGDPLMDLGGALAYWINRDDPEEMQAIRLIPTHLEGMMTRGEVISAYCAKMGLSEGNMEYYYTFGLFRLAVIAQQIYYRFYHGQTKDKRFGMLIYAVHVLGKKAQQVMKTGEI
ncbi:MAG: phosphotransferase family protein [Syntrophales bacterium]|jgi:aminoglycoside phosphotransferase (APT) family kinase protein|nr:phosphotransferase family protein [Syntrophales bacterium]